MSENNMEPIIDKVDRELILRELTPERKLRDTNKGGNEIYIVDAFNAPNTMREIGRLREIAFRDAGGGTGLSCDIDEFDTMENPCRQMVVWVPEQQEIIGGYRFLLGEDMQVRDGVPNIAMSHMFRFSERFMEEYMPQTIELGRSFVVLDYQNTKERPKAIYALDNLWDGLASLPRIYPQIDYLLGKVTMYPNFGIPGRDLILGFMHRHFQDADRLVWPIDALETEAASPRVQSVFTGDYKEDMRILNRELKALDRKVPPLVNAYMGLSPTMRAFGTAVNREFGDVEETGIFFRISEIFDDKKKRHMDTFIPEESGYVATLR